MMTMENQSKVKKIFLLVPALFAAVLMGFMFLSCDVGDEPDPPTGPDAVYDPDFDEDRPGINVRVSPGRVTVPDAAGEGATIEVVAYYRDPNGMPVQGLQMNFTADPASPSFTFHPTATFTDGNGIASVDLNVASTTPTGSYTLVAYTSPASAGPNAKGYGRFYVTYVEPAAVETVSAPTIGGPANPPDTNPALPGITATGNYFAFDSVSSLGNAVTYTIDCGTGQPLFTGLAANAPVVCNFTAATTTVRSRAVSSTGVSSEWAATTVTVTDL